VQVQVQVQVRLSVQVRERDRARVCESVREKMAARKGISMPVARPMDTSKLFGRYYCEECDEPVKGNHLLCWNCHQAKRNSKPVVRPCRNGSGCRWKGCRFEHPCVVQADENTATYAENHGLRLYTGGSYTERDGDAVKEQKPEQAYVPSAPPGTDCQNCGELCLATPSGMCEDCERKECCDTIADEVRGCPPLVCDDPCCTDEAPCDFCITQMVQLGDQDLPIVDDREDAWETACQEWETALEQDDQRTIGSRSYVVPTGTAIAMMMRFGISEFDKHFHAVEVHTDGWISIIDVATGNVVMYFQPRVDLGAHPCRNAGCDRYAFIRSHPFCPFCVHFCQQNSLEREFTEVAYDAETGAPRVSFSRRCGKECSTQCGCTSG
jgi:hypothetical protein